MDQSPHERMQEYQQLAKREREARAEKQAILEDVGTDVAETLEDAIETAGANVALRSTGNEGKSQTFEARFDRATLVASIIDDLPAGFSVKRVNSEGTISIEWERRGESSSEQRATALLKVILTEETETDADGLITDSPTMERVIDRAGEFDISPELAEKRLKRLESMDVIDIDDGIIYPDSNFSSL